MSIIFFIKKKYYNQHIQNIQGLDILLLEFREINPWGLNQGFQHECCYWHASNILIKPLFLRVPVKVIKIISHSNLALVSLNKLQ